MPIFVNENKIFVRESVAAQCIVSIVDNTTAARNKLSMMGHELHRSAQMINRILTRKVIWYQTIGDTDVTYNFYKRIHTNIDGGKCRKQDK